MLDGTKNNSLAAIILLAGSIVFFLMPFRSAIAEESEIALIEKLSELRSDVETLSATLTQEQNDLKDRLRSISAQKTDLEMHIQTEKLRLRKIEQSLGARKEELESSTQKEDDLKPVVQRTIAILSEQVKSGLPFKTEERLQELSGIGEKVESGHLPPTKALPRLWAFVEDELRLGRENGLYRQVIHLDDGERLADVARVGMMMLFFRLGDGRVGRAVHTDKGWVYRTYDTPEDQEQAIVLFESFKKQIRFGMFYFPPSVELSTGGQP